MSLENEDGISAVEAIEAVNESQEKPKILYTRDFLLSLSELEICQKLPSGFDQSLLSEFEDTSHGIQDRPKSHGSLPLQGFRRNEYSSSPPTRGDSTNFSRGVYGRWESRSSGWSDKDSDSQSDLDSDSGRRTYSQQSRRSWQNSEHDGLLGSGSFPRPSAYAAGASATKGQTNEHYQLKRSNEPYHPPRPYKAVPHARASTNDSYNEETFGSSECTSQDRAEEERKRRASFELMRKEQQKVLQEKQKLNGSKHKSDSFADLVLEETKEKGLSETNSELDSAILSVSNNNSGKSSFSAQSSAPRPLVPPGFRTTVPEKNSATRPLISSSEKEIPKPDIEEIQLIAKGNPTQNGTIDNQGKIQTVHQLEATENHPELKMGDDTYRIPGLSEVQESVDGAEVFELATNKVLGKKIVTNSSQESTTSILEKIFGSAPTAKNGGSSGFIEQHESMPDDTLSPQNAQSSKFARWFHEEDKKPVDDLSSVRPNDLLSLIVGGDKVGSQVPSTIAMEHIPSDLSFKIPELTKVVTSSVPSDSEHLYDNNKQEAAPSVPVVLTCEDLEQTILSEYIEKSSNLQPPVTEWNISEQDNVGAKAVDSHASHHLLSLLQKGTGIEDTMLSNTNVGSLETHTASGVGGIDTLFSKQKDENAEDVRNSGQSLTLETLFGTAFMKELQSADAPVSLQRSSGSARTNVFEPRVSSLPFMEEDPFSSPVDGIGSNRMNYEGNLLVSKQKQPPESDKVERWLQFDGPQIGTDSLEFQTEGVAKLPKQAIDGGDIQLPEEETLITVSDSVNNHNPVLAAGNTTKGDPLHSDTVFDIADKLAVLNSGFRGERSMATHEAPRFLRGPFDILEPDRQFNNLHAQASSPQIHGVQMAQNRRTVFHTLDPHPVHVNSQMRFPDHLAQHDTPPHHQFPANMLRPPFHHPDTRITGFDVPAHPQMLPQMQMPGNFLPPHLLRDYPRPSPVPPHPSNQAANFIQEAEPMHGFPFGHRQPNIGGLGMPVPVPEASSGSNHPDAFQRLMEMELRANAKQIRPLNAGHNQGMYGHELDMGFRYR